MNNRRLDFTSGRLFLQRGFTFIETATSLFILSVLLAVAVPSVQASYENRVLQQFVNQFIADYNYTQSLAISHGEVYAIQVVPNAHYYRIQTRHGEMVKRVNYSSSLQVTASDFGAEPNKVKFKADGFLAVNGGQFNVFGKYGNKKLIVQVVTGRIRVEDF